MTDTLSTMIEALCVAGAEWEALHAPTAKAAAIASDPDWLATRAAELVAAVSSDAPDGDALPGARGAMP